MRRASTPQGRPTFCRPFNLCFRSLRISGGVARTKKISRVRGGKGGSVRIVKWLRVQFRLWVRHEKRMLARPYDEAREDEWWQANK